ncbi:MAG: GNAT family N-acetyltransferase [Rubrivivax sp.]
MSSLRSQQRTPRLVLSPYEPGDAEPLFAIMSDPVAMQHTYTAPSLQQCANRLAAFEEKRSSLGFAPWVVRLNAIGNVVGWGGLNVDPEDPAWGVEVSYALTPSVWGCGYATELVRHSLAHASNALSIAQVQAFARPENAASIRVLAKCGFSYKCYVPSLERNQYCFKVENAA